MVRHWTSELRLDAGGRPGPDACAHAVVNGVGAAFTARRARRRAGAPSSRTARTSSCIAMPVLFAAMQGVRRHYARVDREVAPGPEGVPLPSRVHASCSSHASPRPALRALAFARATRPVHAARR